MEKRNKNLITAMLVFSMVLSGISPVFAGNAELFSGENGEYVIIDAGDYDIVNDPECFSGLSANDPDTLLVSFTNGESHPEQKEEVLYVYTMNKWAETLRLYNMGTMTVSGYDTEKPRDITLIGYDGHGESIYINNNLLGIPDDMIDGFSLGEKLTKEGSLPWYEPVPGFFIHTKGYHTYDRVKDEDLLLQLSVSMDIVRDNHDPTGKGEPQTWIRITYPSVEKVIEGSIENPEKQTGPDGKETGTPEWQKNGYKRMFFGENGDYMEVKSGSEYTGKRQKPVVTVSFNGELFTSEKGGKLSLKFIDNKKAGDAFVRVKRVKDKSVYLPLDELKMYFKITPVTVSYDNIQAVIRDGTVRSVKVMTGEKYRKVPKMMWRQTKDSLEFVGNYTGSVSLDRL